MRWKKPHTDLRKDGSRQRRWQVPRLWELNDTGPFVGGQRRESNRRSLIKGGGEELEGADMSLIT